VPICRGGDRRPGGANWRSRRCAQHAVLGRRRGRDATGPSAQLRGGGDDYAAAMPPDPPRTIAWRRSGFPFSALGQGAWSATFRHSSRRASGSRSMGSSPWSAELRLRGGRTYALRDHTFAHEDGLTVSAGPQIASNPELRPICSAIAHRSRPLRARIRHADDRRLDLPRRREVARRAASPAAHRPPPVRSATAISPRC